MGCLKTLHVTVFARLEAVQHVHRPHGSPRGESKRCDHRGTEETDEGEDEGETAAVTAVAATKVEGAPAGIL